MPKGIADRHTFWTSFSLSCAHLETRKKRKKIPLHTQCGKPGFCQKAPFDVFPKRQLTDYPQLLHTPCGNPHQRLGVDNECPNCRLPVLAFVATKDGGFCSGESYCWLSSAVTLSIACRTYCSIKTRGRLTLPLAYLKRVMGAGPSSPITRWNSRHIFCQLQDVFFLRLSSCLESGSSFIVGLCTHLFFVWGNASILPYNIVCNA